MTYAVEFCVCVDAPHLRDESYKPVRAGTRHLVRYTDMTHRAAIGLYDAILRGEYDFLSEYVAHVVVFRPGWRRLVRRRVYRDRQPGFRVARLELRLDYIEHLVLCGHFADPAPVAGEIGGVA